jgi:hypothetical protein
MNRDTKWEREIDKKKKKKKKRKGGRHKGNSIYRLTPTSPHNREPGRPTSSSNSHAVVSSSIR